MGNQQSRNTSGGAEAPSKAPRGNESKNSSPSIPKDTDPSASQTSSTQPLPVPSTPTSMNRYAELEEHRTSMYLPYRDKDDEHSDGLNTSLVDAQIEPQSQRHVASAQQYNNPPRLPLPIGKEIQLPGSPIILPADVSPSIGQVGDNDVLVDNNRVDGDGEGPGILQRRSSVLSNTTADDDDDDMQPLQSSGERAAIPTVIEWRQGGERVYVTGTFAGWDRKFRLQKDGPSKHKDALSVMISLKPGTHHLKFIVDGSMKLSDQLPTAVDFTNILVNYLEITPNDSPYQTASGLSHTRPSAIPNRSHPTKPDANITSAPAVAPLPRPLASASVVAPQTTTPERKYSPAQDRPQSSPVSGVERDQRRVVLTTAEKRVYNSEIPQYLLGLEPLGEVDHFYEQNLPCPPSLPLFLAKSILNMSMPTKDDSSVLKQPNHTVLNHLATSSIRDDVLATSATTRYKRKFLTTILYKPTT